MNAKRFMLLLAVMVFGSLVTVNAQENKKEGYIKPLLGTWQYVEEVAKADGSTIYIGYEIYKTIREDKTYSVMASIDIPIKEADQEEGKISTVTFITQQGEIEMTSESTYLEYINSHYIDKTLNNTISNLRYRVSDKNPNILYIEYNLGDAESGNWVSEVWLKVLPLGAR
jgi:hypothetical protein